MKHILQLILFFVLIALPTNAVMASPNQSSMPKALRFNLSNWKKYLDQLDEKAIAAVLKDLKSPEDYQIHEFKVASTTPPHQHGRLRGERSPFPILLKPKWVLVFIHAKGNWTMKRSVEIPPIISPVAFAQPIVKSNAGKSGLVVPGDADCDARGYPTRWATSGALCEWYDNVRGLPLNMKHAHFGQLILCHVKQKGTVEGWFSKQLLGSRYAYDGDYRVGAVNGGDTEEALFPFFNDLLTDNGKRYENNGGSISCKLVVINGETLVERLQMYFDKIKGKNS